MDHIQFSTSDGVVIHGDWRQVEGSKRSRGALLLHMMPATKESWAAFAEALAEKGISSLAIDERGHGDSTVSASGQRFDYKTFSNDEQKAKRLDVEAAIAWMREKGIEEKNMVIVGASIGANLAIRALVEHPEIRIGVALSPGVDYHSVTTNDAITKLAPSQRVLLYASEDDPESFMSVNDLHDLNRAQTFRVIAENLGHGTTMLEKDPKFLHQIVEWLNQSSRRL